MCASRPAGAVQPPEARLVVAGSHVLLVGTIAGFVPDGERVRTAALQHGPDLVAMGVPPEDIAALERLRREPALLDDLEGLDEVDDALLAALQRFGPTEPAPSPDLAAADEAARGMGGHLHPLDMDDATHTDLFTKLVKVRHLVQRTSARKRLARIPVADIGDPYELARRWDATILRVKPLAAIEAAREQAMAGGITTLADGKRRILAIVPAPRFAGVLEHLQAGR